MAAYLGMCLQAADCTRLLLPCLLLFQLRCFLQTQEALASQNACCTGKAQVQHALLAWCTSSNFWASKGLDLVS